jgi:predicted site-specific integrase-resolvase
MEMRETDTPDLFTGRMTFGYARVSTKAQDFGGQVEQLEAAGCNQVFAEKITARHQNRPELQKMLSKLRASGSTRPQHPRLADASGTDT